MPSLPSRNLTLAIAIKKSCKNKYQTFLVHSTVFLYFALNILPWNVNDSSFYFFFAINTINFSFLVLKKNNLWQCGLSNNRLLNKLNRTSLALSNNSCSTWVRLLVYLSIHQRISTILKTRKKMYKSNVFWYVKVRIFWKRSYYTIHGDKSHMLKKFPSNKIKCTKNVFFFFRELQLITVLLLTCDSYMSWNTRLVYLKLCSKNCLVKTV